MPPGLRSHPGRLIANPKLNPNGGKRVLATRIKCSSRYAVLGAGFAGLSVAWNLLKHGAKEARVCIDIYDEAGIGGGASGASGGLLHPYSPKGKVLWRGAECWKECLHLLETAERAMDARVSDGITQDLSCSFNEPIVLRRGILRPATSGKNADILKENAESCLHDCSLEVLDGDSAQFLVPDICLPFNSAVYMPRAVNIHPKRYLQTLFLACQDVASIANNEERAINLHKKSVHSLRELEGQYDAVIICVGAKANMLPELSGRLPLRTCRGIIAQLQLPADRRGEYSNENPSILSDAWLAFQGPRDVLMGSTWEWGSTEYSSNVSRELASRAFEELLPKATAVYPVVRDWALVGARAGLRAMPPVTPLGALPLLGSVDDALSGGTRCRYWLIGGLGSRGLLYHGLIGRLMAQAVLASDESLLPPELTSWKEMKLWKRRK